MCQILLKNFTMLNWSSRFRVMRDVSCLCYLWYWWWMEFRIRGCIWIVFGGWVFLRYKWISHLVFFVIYLFLVSILFILTPSNPSLLYLIGSIITFPFVANQIYSSAHNSLIAFYTTQVILFVLVSTHFIIFY